MIRIAHLRDENEMGGVARFIACLSEGLGAEFSQSEVRVAPQRMTPLRIDADILVVHITSIWTKLPYLATLRALRPTRPIVLVEHSYTEHFIRRHVAAPERFAVMLRAAYGLAHKVVAVSHGQARWLRANTLVPEAKLSVIRSATNMRDLFSLPPPLARQPDCPLHIGAYGRYAEQKGFSVLIEAFERLPPDRFRLSLRGLGPDRAQLLAKASGHRNIIVGGPTHHTADFLSTLDAVVVPSLWEAFGQVAAEARAAARPLIATNVDGLPEQVTPEYGDIIEPSDPAALANAILALEHRDLTAMGLAARRSAIHHEAAMLAGWRQLISALVTSPAEVSSQSSPT